MTTWASHPLSTPADEFLAGIRSTVPVKLIATPRSHFLCRSIRDWQEIEADPEISGFDQVPLTDPGGDKIEAVFVRGKGLVTLNEEMFIASNAPLLSFLESADRQTFRLLVDGCKVSGLVTLSDIQKLPVYSILFSLVIVIEMLLMAWIRQECGSDEDRWLGHLTKRDRREINNHWERAKKRKVDLDRLSYASLGQEIRAASALGLFFDRKDWEKRLKAVQRLRNRVFHANEVAPTPEEAAKIPPQVRELQKIVGWLQEQIGDSVDDR